MNTSIENGTLFALKEQRQRGIAAWAGTTAGVVFMLLTLQFVTGTLIAFYYVPSVAHAHTTVAFIEKVVPSGSWIRALHHHGSQWLTVFLCLHIVQLFWRDAYRTQRVGWLFSIIMLALVLNAGGTGYSLPWDARAFFSTRVAEGLAGGLPIIGFSIRRWLLGGDYLSTLTLSRFHALHVLVVPFLILLTTGVCLVLSSSRRSSQITGSFFTFQIARNSIAAGVVFVALVLYASRVYAPLGPAATELTPGYLPRPGAQFVWLYQLLKYSPGRMGSIVAVALPGALFIGLAALPFLEFSVLNRISVRPRRLVGTTLLSLSIGLVTVLTTLSYISDRSDSRTREQLAKQAAEEAAFRAEPFVPVLIGVELEVAGGRDLTTSSGPPETYLKHCATCHGERGEGVQQGPLKFPALLDVASKPRRSVADIMALLDDPKAYGLEPPMKSFADKLTAAEKRAIAEWLVTLKR